MIIPTLLFILVAVMVIRSYSNRTEWFSRGGPTSPAKPFI
jgi:hypothetical protein